MILVKEAIAAITADFRHVYGLLVYADLPAYGANRPHPVTGHIPDVFAVDTPETLRVIGEAKTPVDFETDRSCRQIKAFLAHLARVPNSSFYLAVPSHYRARASGLLADWAKSANATQVHRVIASCRL